MAGKPSRGQSTVIQPGTKVHNLSATPQRDAYATKLQDGSKSEGLANLEKMRSTKTTPLKLASSFNNKVSKLIYIINVL